MGRDSARAVQACAAGYENYGDASANHDFYYMRDVKQVHTGGVPFVRERILDAPTVTATAITNAEGSEYKYYDENDGGIDEDESVHRSASDAVTAISPSDVAHADVDGDDHDRNTLGRSRGAAGVRVLQDKLVEVIDSYVAEGVRDPVASEVLANRRSTAEQFGYPLSLRRTKYDVRGNLRFV